MTRIALVFSIAGALIFGIFVLPATPARADDLNQATCLTFSGPIELPTVALPAGSYLFKHPEGDNERHIVQVFSSDGKQVLGTFLTIPQERLEPSDKTAVTFTEAPVGAPEAVKAWFYPYERMGEEFVYPRAQAIKIAQATHQSVLATSSALSNQAEMRNAAVVRVSDTGATEETPASVPTRGMRSLTNSTGKSFVLWPCTAE